MRQIYTLFWILSLPLVLARLCWRGLKERGYWHHIGERFGFYASAPNAQNTPLIWIHAVSVGETRAAEPLIRALHELYPTKRILLTHMTPTGRATGKALFVNNDVEQAFLPYDIPFLCRRFLRHFKPQICVLMETEVWPNLIHTCQQRNVPVALVNARLSPKSLRKAQKLSGLIIPATKAINVVGAQTPADAERIKQLGAAQVTVTGNTKFDVTMDARQIAQGLALRHYCGNRPILLCASTREGEEELILDALLAAQNHSQDTLPSNLLLLIVPRHPQRFDVVERLITARGFSVKRRSQLKLGRPFNLDNKAALREFVGLSKDIEVVLGDSMGEMPCYFASCDIAFIGGSLLPLGGQNLIEACAVGKPVLLGPHTFNFEVISNDAIETKAALRVTNADELLTIAARLLNDINAQKELLDMGKAAMVFAKQHRGATLRTVALIKKWLH